MLEAVIGHRHSGPRLPARLRGFAKIRLPALDYPGLIVQPGASTEGLLIVGLSESDLDKLDEYEEVEGGIYRRVRVEVEVVDSRFKQAQPGRAAHAYLAGAAFER